MGAREAIVDGEVSPDQWLIDKATGDIVSEHIMKKSHMTQFETKGVSLQPVQVEKTLKACLDKEQVKQLVAISMTVQDLYKKATGYRMGI